MEGCQYDGCEVPKLILLTPPKLMYCTCGCEKRMHVKCVIEHNKKITHILQTNREMKKWQ